MDGKVKMGGFDCFLDGFALVRKPGLRRYFIIPVAINAMVLAALLTFTIGNFNLWVDTIMEHVPGWMSFAYWLVWLIAFLAVLFLAFYAFIFAANIIASPFHAVLSVKVEETLTGKPPTSILNPWLALPRAVAREIRKLLYALPRLSGLLVITFIPVLNAVSPILWVLFSAWMMAIQYSDYGADNNGVTFAELRRRLSANRLQSLLFGLPAYLLLAVPVVNLILVPVAVAGGTRFWVEHLKRPVQP